MHSGHHGLTAVVTVDQLVLRSSSGVLLGLALRYVYNSIARERIRLHSSSKLRCMPASLAPPLGMLPTAPSKIAHYLQ